MSTFYEAVEDLGPNYVRELAVVYRGPRRRLDRLASSRDVNAFARKLDLHNQMTEHFIMIMLDNKHRPIGWSTIAIGSMTACPVSPTEAFKLAIRSSASGLVFVHNHPSGETTPSPEDVALTERLCRAGELLGVPVLDHVVVGDDTYFSFLDAGLLGVPS